MDQTFSWSTSMWVISFVRLLERTSYYGIRAFLIFYAVDQLGIEQNDAFRYYALFTTGVYLFNIPMGLLTDFLLKQKRAILIGFVFLIVGYLIMLVPNIYSMLFALFIVSMGLGLVSPNMTVLMGRIFKKQDQRRNLGFVIHYTGINVGAFLGVLILGYAGEVYSYKFSFILAAVIALIAAVIFALTMHQFNLVEDNRSKSGEESMDDNPEILDYNPGGNLGFKKPPPLPASAAVDETIYLGRYFMIFIMLISAIVFWQIFEVTSYRFFDTFDVVGSLSNLGINVSQSIVYGFQSYFILPMSVLFFLFLSFKKRVSTINLLGIGFIFIAIYMSFFFFENLTSDASILSLTIVNCSLVAAAEIIISGIGLSYVTRLSNVKFSSTTIGVYIMLIALGNKLITSIIHFSDEINIFALAIVPLILGLVFIAGRKVFLQITGGLD